LGILEVDRRKERTQIGFDVGFKGFEHRHSYRNLNINYNVMLARATDVRGTLQTEPYGQNQMEDGVQNSGQNQRTK
jgi:hypothetical protein